MCKALLITVAIDAIFNLDYLRICYSIIGLKLGTQAVDMMTNNNLVRLLRHLLSKCHNLFTKVTFKVFCVRTTVTIVGIFSLEFLTFLVASKRQ